LRQRRKRRASDEVRWLPVVHKAALEIVEDAPTIIPADREESDEG